MQNTWLKCNEASSSLGVSKSTLENWRKLGYLKIGTHWRYGDDYSISYSYLDIFYHVTWCKEEMDYWESHHASIPYIAV